MGRQCNRRGPNKKRRTAYCRSAVHRRSSETGEVQPEADIRRAFRGVVPDDFLVVLVERVFEPAVELKVIRDIEVRAESYVTLNGSGSQPFIDPSVDLTTISEGFTHKSWILNAKQM